MRYAFELKKFLYSQHLFSGFRISLGIVLPAVVLLFGFDNHEVGFTLASGAIAASVVDLPGPLKYKHNEMLACSFLGFLSALVTGLATSSAVTLWVTVVPLTFVLSMMVMLGAKGPQISFATLYMMIVNLDQHFTPMEALVNASWLLGGSLWYTYWSYLLSRWQRERIERQVIADALFATADYLSARARFFDASTSLEDNHNNLITMQVSAIEQQEAARDIVLRSLPRLKRSDGDPNRTRLFNLFMSSVDLHETAVSAHTDYAMLRNTFGDAEVLLFLHDLIEKCAADLRTIGLAVLMNRPCPTLIRNKSEVPAIEHEIERMRRRDFPARDSEAYAAINATFRRVWTVVRLTARMQKSTLDSADKIETEMRVDQTLSRFLVSRRITVSQLLSNLTTSSPSFRHALRVTLAVALGLALGKLLPIANSYWIVLTTVIILKPGFSLTRQRNTQRIVGTVIGCAGSIAFLYLVKSTPIQFGVMLGCMFMAYALLLINYAAAVVFISAYVLLLYNLLAPIGMRLIGERALDTIIGCTIAVAISYLFANWEYRGISPLLKTSLTAIREYIEALRESVKSASVANQAKAARPATFESDYRYRLARKTVHVAYANLGQAFRRMMREPKSKRRFVAELNDILVQSHTLTSQITAAAPLIATVGNPEPAALQRVLDAIRRNLEQAEDPDSTPDVAEIVAAKVEADETRALTRALDDYAVATEQAGTLSPERLQDLKVLVYQCKQMLRSSLLIRKDAIAMQRGENRDPRPVPPDVSALADPEADTGTPGAR